VANGSHEEGPARADRLRDKYAKYERQTQRAIDSLPPYRAEEDSEAEITGSWKNGIHAKGIPSRSMRWFVIALSVALVILAAAKGISMVLEAKRSVSPLVR